MPIHLDNDPSYPSNLSLNVPFSNYSSQLTQIIFSNSVVTYLLLSVSSHQNINSMREVLSLTLNIFSSDTQLTYGKCLNQQIDDATDGNEKSWHKGYKFFLSIQKGPLDECLSNIFIMTHS